ncbi:MAG: UbiX family flavin prenyltransferase [Phycisphaerae bacterium]
MGGREIILAITGASGGPYALRLLDCLDKAGVQTHLIVSPNGRRLLADECDVRNIEDVSLLGRACERIRIHDYEDIGGLLASGSHHTDGMVICPCSSNTLGTVASGRADNLIGRAACVTLKEGRRLVIVHREMPVNGIDLENMLRMQRAGAIICPASPAFYLRPRSIDDLIDFVVARVLDLLQVPHTLNARRQETPSP